MKIKNLFLAMSAFLAAEAAAQPKVNYDEKAIVPYTLPQLMISENGKPIKTKTDWETYRRPELLALFEREMFGKVPGGISLKPQVQVEEYSENAVNGKAIRKQVSLRFQNKGQEITMHLLTYLPKNVKQPHVFIGYNFYGNHTIAADPAIVLTSSWIDNNEGFGITENKANDASRGVRHSRWPVEKIIDQGFGLCTVYYGDVDPDRNDFTDGLHPLFYKDGQAQPAADEWGAIAAWSWGASRVLDYLKTESLTSSSKFIMFGHSRLGKTALWAGATDTRFDAVISNDSGCGGAAISRRKFGETLQIINTAFPHWFADNFEKYNGREETLPFDQHQLIALIAPRPVYIASAADDLWADPKGEYLSGHYATQAYALYGKTGLPNAEPPAIHSPVHGTGIGYHIRSGEHDVKAYDWEQYMIFCKANL